MTEDCLKNHWAIASSDKEIRFCPYCGENIERFHGIRYDSPKEQNEDERVNRAWGRQKIGRKA